MVENLRRLPSRLEWRSHPNDSKIRALYEAITFLEQQFYDVSSDLNRKIEELEREIRLVKDRQEL